MTLPVTLEGTLAADVAEGEVDEGGYSDVNFGTLTVDGEALGVQVSGAVLRSAGLQDGTGKVRARLTARTDEYGWPVYTVSELQRLEAHP